MKNIHILATNQPSRLFLNHKGVLDLYPILSNLQEARHIYITSSQKIAKGVNTWYLDKFLNKPRNSGGAEYAFEQDVIILTTDLFLIEHSIQAIDDKFLERFCQNPTCEFVEVKELLSNNGNAFYGYKIIIPQEEPKLDNLEERFKRDMSMVVMPLDNENIPEEPNKLYVVINLIELYKMVVM
jgi:hypothetical protein